MINRVFLLVFVSLLAVLLPSVSAEISFEMAPVWTSSDLRCSTGGVVADFDRDGFLDFAVSNGNDMALEPEVIYWGSVTGVATDPGWVSTDEDYSGHCIAGDLNGDLFPELIVGNYITSPTGFTPSIIKLYANNNGVLSDAPIWSSADLNNTFSVALGDVDGDGDLDLACANGESYTQQPQPNDIYLNEEGELSVNPDWISEDADCSYDLEFADFDQDGDLDLAVANSRAPTRIYSNNGTMLETAASWSSTVIDNDNSLTWADVDGDSWVDLAVITNAQINPSTGKIKVFMNRFGTIETTPSWSVFSPGTHQYGSALVFRDFDNDLDLDLAAGSWWSQVVVYENNGHSLDVEPIVVSNNAFVIEQIAVWTDSEGRLSDEKIIRIDKPTSIIMLPGNPPEIIREVHLNGNPVQADHYCVDPACMWISFDRTLEQGDELRIAMERSGVMDLLVTSWGDSGAQGPNYGYRNTSTTPPLERSIELKANQAIFEGGDAFHLAATIKNPMESFGADLYILMEVEGLFFFYPEWTQVLQSVPVQIGQYDRLHLPVLDFTFGPSIGYEGTIRFYGAIFHPGTFDLACPYHAIELRLSEGN